MKDNKKGFTAFVTIMGLVAFVLGLAVGFGVLVLLGNM